MLKHDIEVSITAWFSHVMPLKDKTSNFIKSVPHGSNLKFKYLPLTYSPDVLDSRKHTPGLGSLIKGLSDLMEESPNVECQCQIIGSV